MYDPVECFILHSLKKKGRALFFLQENIVWYSCNQQLNLFEKIFCNFSWFWGVVALIKDNLFICPPNITLDLFRLLAIPYFRISTYRTLEDRLFIVYYLIPDNFTHWASLNRFNQAIIKGLFDIYTHHSKHICCRTCIKDWYKKNGESMEEKKHFINS